MSSAYPSSYAARSAAAYNNVNSNLNRNLRSPNNMAPRVGTFPSVQAHQNQTQNYSQDFEASTQSRLLNECSRRIQEQAYYMRRAMDEDDLAVTLERATFMLSELGAGPNNSSSNKLDYSNANVAVGSSKLSPKNYYEIQMKAMDEMPNLEEFFLSLDVEEETPTVNSPPAVSTNAGYFAGIVDIPDAENETSINAQNQPSDNASPKPDPILELYETVQYCPRVLPRLYLQICAGTALLRSRASKTNAGQSSSITSVSVMKDLMDHVKCVQSPIRGLFLRNYVLQIFKYPMEETLEDLYKYLLQNFVEMNQLWVRIQHLPSSKGNNVKPDKHERRKREKERNELRLLVGTNLVRLSQLDGMTPAIYKEHILPPILEQIVTCKDALAQAYLMDCIIQVFPDDYHIETMPIFLEILPKLKEKVNVRTVIQGMMERLSNYYNENTEAIVSIETYENLNTCVQTISTTRTAAAQNPNSSKNKPNHSEIIHLQTYLFQFSLQHFPDHFFHLDQILNQCADTLNVFCATALMDDSAMTDLEKLLTIPLEKLSLKVLELNSFGSLLEFLPWDKRKKVGKGLIQAVIADGKGLKDVEEMESLLKIITPLLKDIPNHMRTGNEPAYDMAEINDDQNWVAKLVHVFHHDDTDVMFQMLNSTRKYFTEAGKGRVENTSSSLVFATMKLVKRVYALEFKKEFEEVEKAREKEKIEKAEEEKNVEEAEKELNKLEIKGGDEDETSEVEKSDKGEPVEDESEDAACEEGAKEKAKYAEKEETPEEERAEPSLFDDPEPVVEVLPPNTFNKNIK